MSVCSVFILKNKPVVKQETLGRLLPVSIENLLIFFDVNKSSHKKSISFVIEKPICLVRSIMIEHFTERHNQISFRSMDPLSEVSASYQNMSIFILFKTPSTDLRDMLHQKIINLP